MSNERPTTSVQLWAADELYSTGPVPGQPTKIVPSAGQAQEGFVPGFQYPAEFKNYNQNLDAQWLQYLEEASKPGRVITNFSGMGQKDNPPVAIDILGFAQSSEVFLALDGNGQIYASVNGRNFGLLSSDPPSALGAPTSMSEDPANGVVMYSVDNAAGNSKVYVSDTSIDSWADATGITHATGISVLYTGVSWIQYADTPVGNLMAWSTDDGATWTPVTRPAQNFYAADTSTGYVIAVGSGAFTISTDGGVSWPSTTVFPTLATFGDVFFDATLDEFIVLGEEGSTWKAWGVNRLTGVITTYLLPIESGGLAFGDFTDLFIIGGTWFIAGTSVVGGGMISTMDQGQTYRTLTGYDSLESVYFGGNFFFQYIISGADHFFNRTERAIL